MMIQLPHIYDTMLEDHVHLLVFCIDICQSSFIVHQCVVYVNRLIYFSYDVCIILLAVSFYVKTIVYS
jgi:uncharacterized membrane protein YczE